MKNLTIRNKLILFLSLFLFFAPTGYGSRITITEVSTPDNFPLVTTGEAAQLVIDPNEEEVISVVTTAFCEDIKSVAEVKPEIIHLLSDESMPVIIGTLGKSSFIDQLESTGKIQTKEVRGKWETFCISVVDNPFPRIKQALVIFGSDPRGTAFGVFELSRMIGVSPFVWWADVTPEKRPNIYVTPGESIFGPPSVQYRGIFLNDEDWGLQPWAAKHMDPGIRDNGTKGDIGPKTYEKIFELMLRLKANYLWPAMHECTKAFWYYKENPAIAKKYHIVMGSTHCDMMLRTNTDEWVNNFATEYPGVTRGDWNWATNRNNIMNYWTDRVIESKNHDAVYTIGMRGIHDSRMPGYSSQADRAEALKEVIKTQREMLSTQLGKSASEVPQIFCPYKEALNLYRLGIDLADDISLLWADDNFGYIRQLSNPQEQQRSGGGGVYYHFSYWGVPQDFLWLASTPPALTAFELMKAYEMNCHKIWIFNVGDIKPQEYELQFAMDFSWDIHSVNMEDANEYAKKWSDETFGEGFAEEMYEIKKEYYRLVSSGKPEHVPNTNYTVHEMEHRLSCYDKLVDRVYTLENSIPVEMKDAYFQLITYQIEAAALMDMKVLGSKLSFEYVNQGRKKDALDIAEKSQNAYRRIIELTNQYNKEIAGGKWDGMMDYAPRGLSKFHEMTVATTESINENALASKDQDKATIIPAGDYTSKHGNGYEFLVVGGLGDEAKALTVWPLNMETYTESNITSAPYVEYTVAVKKGTNMIEIRCLPTFPLYQGLQLRFAASIGDEKPSFFNIKTEAETKNWSTNILRGYANGSMTYQSIKDTTIIVRVYFPDPGLVLNSLHITTIVAGSVVG